MDGDVSDRQIIALLLLIIVAVAIAATVMMMDAMAKRIIIVTSMVLDCDDTTGVCTLLASDTVQKELINKTDPKLKQY